MIFDRYPALRIAVLVMVSVILFRVSRVEFISQLSLAGLAAAFAAISLVLHVRKYAFPAQAAFAVAVFLVIGSRYSGVSRLDETLSHLSTAGRMIKVYGVVDEMPKFSDDITRFVLQVDSIGVSNHIALSTSGKVLVSVKGRAEIAYGDPVRTVGRLVEPRNRRNPGEFDYAEYLRHRGVLGMLNIRSTEELEITGDNRGRWIYRSLIDPMKTHFLQTTRSVQDPQYAAILNGLLVGVRQDIDPSVLDSFSKSGTIHILSISGLHVAFIAGMLFGVFSLVRLPYRLRIYFTIGCLVFYAAVTDFVPSVSRATLMIVLVLVGRAHERRGSVLNSLMIALVIILLVDPRTLFEIGFQLSFTAVLALVLLYPKLERWAETMGLLKETTPKLLKRTIQLLLVSLAAQLGTLPLSAYYFNNVPLLAIAANVVVVPLSGVVMGIGFLTVAVAPLSTTLAEWYGAVNDGLMYLMIQTVHLAVQLPLAGIRAFGFGAMEALVFYLAMAAALAWSYRPVRRWTAYAVVGGVCTTVIIGLLAGRPLEVYFLDVGQGDASIVRTPGGKVLVIDGGDRDERYDAGERIVAPMLRRLGVERIDYVVASHPHDDHIGGLSYLVRTFEVGTVLDAGQFEPSVPHRELLSAVEERGCSLQMPRAGDILAIEDDIQLYFFHPSERFVSSGEKAPFNTNNTSLVMQMKYRYTGFLWMGDAEREALREMRKFGSMLESQVLKVGHHGSWNGTDDRLLSAIRPDWAVISCGLRNKFDHPSPWVLDVLQREGAAIARTDYEGAIVFTSDGDAVTRLDYR